MATKVSSGGAPSGAQRAPAPSSLVARPQYDADEEEDEEVEEIEIVEEIEEEEEDEPGTTHPAHPSHPTQTPQQQQQQRSVPTGTRASSGGGATATAAAGGGPSPSAQGPVVAAGGNSGSGATRKPPSAAAAMESSHNIRNAHNDDYDDGDGNDDDYDEDYDDDEEDGEYDGEEEEEEVDQQEDLMNYSTFPINAIKGHHIMYVAAYSRFIYVGTNQGVVALLEQTGQECKRFHHHMDPVSDICCDEKENYFAASDKAGVVSAQNIWDESEYFRKEFDHPLQAVAIHPRYGSMDDRPIVCGGSDKVILITKTIFLGNRKTTILQERQGKIHAVRWCGDTIAWANDRGVTLYTYSSRSPFAFFPRPVDSPKPDLYRCCLFWETPSSLVIGWADWVQIFHVRECTVEERVAKKELTRLHKAEIQGGFRSSICESPYRICGLAPFGDDKFLMLAAVVEVEGLIHELEIRIVNRRTFADEFRGSMPHKHRHPLQFSLAYFQAETFLESTFFIVSVDAVIKATPCDDDDHVEHLLRHHRYQEAYDYAKTVVLKRRTIDEIGRNLIDYLVGKEEYEKAASQFAAILGTTDEASEVWENWIQLFDQKEESEVLVKYLPYLKTSGRNKVLTGPKIRKEYYELVLNRCLENDLPLFKEAVQKFDGLFDYNTVANAVESKYLKMRKERAQGRTVNEVELRILGETYGLLLEQQDKNDDALAVLMEIKGSSDLFAFIRKKELYTKACSILPDLFRKSVELTLTLLLEHIKGDDSNELDPLNPEAVFKRLEGAHRDFLWLYVKGVQKADRQVYHQVCRKHAQLIAFMYADFEPSGLLGFLKEMSNHLTKMREIHALCKQRGLLEEMVFLMARMGKQDEGLRIIVEDMKNVAKAIAFIKDFPSDEDQIELFKKLVDYVQEVNNNMLGQRGNKYFDHLVQDGETWESIANRYGIKEVELRSMNGASGAANSTLPRPHVRVPMNMLAALLVAVSDPSVSEQTAIDPIYLIKLLPPTQHIPNIGESLSRIAKSKAAHKALMETLMRVLNGDIGELQRRLHRNRSRGIRVDPRSRFCYYCNEICAGTNVVSFTCTHTYHPKCVVDYMVEDGHLKPDVPVDDADAFVADPTSYVKQKSKAAPVLLCRVCPPIDDDTI